MVTIDWFLMKMLPEMHPWTRKPPLNFESHLESTDLHKGPTITHLTSWFDGSTSKYFLQFFAWLTLIHKYCASVEHLGGGLHSTITLFFLYPIVSIILNFPVVSLFHWLFPAHYNLLNHQCGLPPACYEFLDLCCAYYCLYQWKLCFTHICNPIYLFVLPHIKTTHWISIKFLPEMHLDKEVPIRFCKSLGEYKPPPRSNNTSDSNLTS